MAFHDSNEAISTTAETAAARPTEVRHDRRRDGRFVFVRSGPATGRIRKTGISGVVRLASTDSSKCFRTRLRTAGAATTAGATMYLLMAVGIVERHKGIPAPQSTLTRNRRKLVRRLCLDQRCQ